MNTEEVLRIRVVPTDAAIADVTQRFAMLDKNRSLPPPEPTLSLPSVDAYYSLLTPKRLELLRELRRRQPTSIRALSQQVQRDYKNVHTDVVALIEAGLIERNADKEIFTPWNRFEVSLPLQDSAVDEAA
jgi:predicted transcriptional regulator